MGKLRQQQTGLPLGQPDPVTYKSIELPTETDYGNLMLQNKPERWSFAAEPTLTQSIGGAESFYMYQLGAKGSADLAITDHWSMGGTANLNIINNYDKFN